MNEKLILFLYLLLFALLPTKRFFQIGICHHCNLINSTFRCAVFCFPKLCASKGILLHLTFQFLNFYEKFSPLLRCEKEMLLGKRSVQIDKFLDSPLVQHLPTYFQSAWQSNLFSPNISTSMVRLELSTMLLTQLRPETATVTLFFMIMEMKKKVNSYFYFYKSIIKPYFVLC